MTNGTVAISLKWEIITVVDETLNLCDVAKDAGLSCPLAIGTHSVKATETIPGIAPPVRSMLCCVRILLKCCAV